MDLNHIQSLILVSGLSGAGRSSALDILEDVGFAVVENLPVPLITDFLDHTLHSPDKFQHTALIPDLNSRESLVQLDEILGSLSSKIKTVQTLFLDSRNDVIVKRYSQTRRPHPNFQSNRDQTLRDTVTRERDRLAPLRERADLIVDTSELTIHDLKREIRGFVDSLGLTTDQTMRVNFLSFGFKHGAPTDCDLIMDVRFLPNPHFIPTLQPLTGLDPDVAHYVLEQDDTKTFLRSFGELLRFLIPRYAHEGKAYLNIGIGCTGGQHRSVAIADTLAQTVSAERCLVSAKHRDLEKR